MWGRMWEEQVWSSGGKIRILVWYLRDKEACKNDFLVSGFEDLGVVFLLTQEEAWDQGADGGEEFSSCLF